MSSQFSWLQRLQHLVLPSSCLWCQQLLAIDEAQLCQQCHRHLPQLDAAMVAHNALHLPAVAQGLPKARFDALYTLSWYQQPYRHWIRHWKFQQGHAEGELLCQLMAEKAYSLTESAGTRPGLVSFAPISAARLRERGFNQAQCLAQQLAAVWQRPCRHLFQSPQLIPHQTGLSRRERLKNLTGKIQLTATNLPSHIVLVDDVVTTGATMDHLCLLLKQAGVMQVDVWCLAVTPYSSTATSALS